MQVINTNVMSLNAQRNLSSSGAQLAVSLQRLSSGLRINSAKDDAAGMAISERFTTQIRGMDQAARNANDGISLAQTAEGAMGEIANNLQRIRELAVQSRNATNSATDRAALNAEAQQLKSEIDRVAGQTQFNGVKLLDGSFSNAVFQVGANQGETITVSGITNANSASLGSWTGIATAATTSGVAPVGSGATTGSPAGPSSQTLGALTAGVGATATDTYALTFTSGTDVLTINHTGANVSAADIAAGFVAAGFAADGSGTEHGFTLNLGSAANIAAAITGGTLTVNRTDGAAFTSAQATSDGSGGAASYTTAPSIAGLGAAAAGTPAVPATPATFSAGTFSLNGQTISVGAAATGAARLSDLVTAINASSAGVTASVANGALSLSANDNTSNITVGGGTFAANLTAQAGLTAGASVPTPGAVQSGFASLDISSVGGADLAMLAMDGALTAINSARATMGAVQNRFSSVVANLSTTSENLSAARSRIQDADFAKETAQLTRNQILQQAGTAMLAQANQSPQGVLSLLR